MGEQILSAGEGPVLEFRHRQSAHCESGVTSNLLRDAGREVSEAMVFGIGSGLFFAYLPFLKIGSLPLTTYRTFPGAVFKKAALRLGARIKRQRFGSAAAAMDALVAMLDRGQCVGCQTGVYWLPYFPSSMRFHFNAHHIVIYGRRDDEYLVSDPTLEHPVTISRHHLAKARFACGPLAPHGKMFWVSQTTGTVDWRRAIVAGLRETCGAMRLPIPLVGWRGIRFLADRMAKWPQRLGAEHASLCLGNVIRMQEEIGTGGGGFRFIFAAFLQEAADRLQEPALAAMSQRLTAVGDRWRDFALEASRFCKGRSDAVESTSELAAIIADCGERERSIFTELAAITRSLKADR
jgi:hypothetical protein